MNNTPNEFIEEFKIQLDKTKNKSFLIEKEIKRIDAILYTNKNNFNFNDDRIELLKWIQSEYEEETTDPWAFLNNEEEVFLIDCETIREIFDEYQKTGECIFNERKPTRKKEFTKEYIEHFKWQNQQRKKNIKIVKKFTDFYNWLKELEKEYLTKPNTKKSSLTLKQKLLALHYLGLNMNQTDNTNTAKILSQILDAGQENIRKSLSYISNGKNNVRTESNLKIVSNLFENHSLTEISNKIKEEIK